MWTQYPSRRRWTVEDLRPATAAMAKASARPRTREASAEPASLDATVRSPQTTGLRSHRTERRSGTEAVETINDAVGKIKRPLRLRRRQDRRIGRTATQIAARRLARLSISISISISIKLLILPPPPSTSSSIVSTVPAALAALPRSTLHGMLRRNANGTPSGNSSSRARGSSSPRRRRRPGGSSSRSRLIEGVERLLLLNSSV